MSRLGSQGWTDLGQRDLGRMVQQLSPPWTCSAWSHLRGTTIFRSRWALLPLTKPHPPKGWWTLWARRALKSYLVSTSPAGKVPTSSLLPYSLPTSRGQLHLQSGFPGVGICLGVKREVEVMRQNYLVVLFCFFLFELHVLLFHCLVSMCI